MSVSLCYLVLLIFISGSESQINYEIKPITFCPVVTLDGHLSNYNDRSSLATNSTTIAECSLECSTREHNLWCQAFTFDPESSTCQLHSSSPNRGSSLTEVAWYDRSTANTDPLGGRIVKLPGANKSITHLMQYQRLYPTASASGCLFPFTLNGSLYRETCSIIYTHIPGNCNTSVCPVLYSGSSVDDPFVYWATCDRYNYEQKISIVSMPIVCGDLNGTLIKIPELNWILVQSKMWRSDEENYFNKSWVEFKEGFNSSYDHTIDFNFNYWIGNEILHQLTNLSCYKIFPDIPTPSPIPEKTMTELTAAATTLATSDLSSDLPLTTAATTLETNVVSHDSPLTTTAATTLTTSGVNSDLTISTLSPANNYSETTTSNMNQTNSTETTARAANKTILRYRLIARRYWRLRIEMGADDGSWYSTEYNSFKVFSEDDNYRIELKLYEVGASDLMNNMLSNQSAPFATYDRNAINPNYSNAFPGTPPSTTAPAGWWWDDNTTSTLINDDHINCLSSLNSYTPCWRNVKGQVIRFRQTRMYMQPIQQVFNVSY